MFELITMPTKGVLNYNIEEFIACKYCGISGYMDTTKNHQWFMKFNRETGLEVVCPECADKHVLETSSTFMKFFAKLIENWFGKELKEVSSRACRARNEYEQQCRETGISGSANVMSPSNPEILVQINGKHHELRAWAKALAIMS